MPPTKGAGVYNISTLWRPVSGLKPIGGKAIGVIGILARYLGRLRQANISPHRSSAENRDETDDLAETTKH